MASFASLFGIQRSGTTNQLQLAQLKSTTGKVNISFFFQSKKEYFFDSSIDVKSDFEDQRQG